MRPLSIALILTFPLTCFAGPWSELIASTMETTVVASAEYTNETSCRDGVCTVRRVVQRAVVATPTQVVRSTTRVRYRQSTRTRILRRPLFARRFRCCR